MRRAPPERAAVRRPPRRRPRRQPPHDGDVAEDDGREGEDELAGVGEEAVHAAGGLDKEQVFVLRL